MVFSRATDLASWSFACLSAMRAASNDWLLMFPLNFPLIIVAQIFPMTLSAPMLAHLLDVKRALVTPHVIPDKGKVFWMLSVEPQFHR